MSNGASEVQTRAGVAWNDPFAADTKVRAGSGTPASDEEFSVFRYAAYVGVGLQY